MYESIKMSHQKVDKPKARATRSKSGCINCKKRKKKCDEIKPICTGCLRRNIICEYKEPPSDFGNAIALRININNSSSMNSADTEMNLPAYPDLISDIPQEKISKLSSIREVVGDTVMKILENNVSNLNSLFDTQPTPSLEDFFSIDTNFLNIFFENDPQYLDIFNNTTTPIPKSLEIKLPVELTFEELSYFEYYCKKILPNLSILPQEFNYYSKIYIPIAFKEKAVLYTLVGWGCRMRKNQNLNFQVENKEADRYTQLVNSMIEQHNMCLDREKFITNFVCYMILVCMEISFGDTSSKWSHYFTCCFHMINKMPGAFRFLLSNCSIEGNLLAENFAYFDVLASQSNENGTFYPISDYHELFSMNNTNKNIHDPLQGCIRPVILLIGEIVSMLVEYSSLQISLDLPDCDKFEVVSKMMEKSERLDKQIKFAKPDLSCLQFLKTPEELEFHLTLFEVYQLSTQLYLRQVIRKLPPVVPEIQVLGYNLREDLKILLQSSELKNSLAFPMLLLGISSTTKEDRKEVHDMFMKLIQNCGYLSSYQKLLIVVEKIWALNRDGSIYVDWFKVTKQLGWRLNLGR